MSERRQPLPDDRMRRLLEDLQTRLLRIEQGLPNHGTVSFGAVRIDSVVITVTPGGGSTRNVVFRNLLNGATYTIVL